jgi:hypothetical protein
MPTSFAGENLIYKYLDANLFAISTLNEALGKLSVHVINGVSGKVVYKFAESDIDALAPVDMVFTENFLVVAFRRITGEISTQELSVAELYHSRMEQDTLTMLKDHYLGADSAGSMTDFTSLHHDMPVVSHVSYTITQDIKRLSMSQTASHVTAKLLVMLTDRDQVYSIQHAVFSARRQTKTEAELQKEKEEETLTNFGKYNITTYSEPDYYVKSTEFP